MNKVHNLKAVAESVRKKLDYHGYAFQQAVFMASFSSNAAMGCGHHWEPCVAEFPAKPPHFDPTHIDLILRSTSAPLWMVVECKRSMTTDAHWCFIEPNFMGRRIPPDEIFIETVAQHPDGDGVSATGKMIQYKDSHRYVGMFTAIQNPMHPKATDPEAEEPKGTKRAEDAFRTACRQLMQGVNGLVEELNKNPGILGNSDLGLLPVIVTTASLFRITGARQKDALKDGRLSVDSLEAFPAPWLLYHFVQTPDLKHSLGSSHKPVSDLAQVLPREYIRTIAVVSAQHWMEFLDEWDWQGCRFGDVL